MGWRYIATRLNGDGTETFLDYEIPITDAKILEQLSGPGRITGYITPEVARLRDPVTQRPIFEPWSTAIYAEADGVLRGGAILVDLVEEGHRLEIDAVGFTGYAKGQPYTGEWSKTNIDPALAAREIWTHLQGKPKGNLGMRVSPFTTPVRIGNETKESTSSSTSGAGSSTSTNGNTGVVTVKPGSQTTTTKTKVTPIPYELAWWKTSDVGTEFDKLAKETPFDYRTIHRWDGTKITHDLHVVYPEIKTRREDLRFVVGENIYDVPTLEYAGDEYASEVLVVGAGEGRKAIRGTANKTPTRLRRAVMVQDSSTTAVSGANKLAGDELKARLGEVDISQIVQIEHPHAPRGAVNVGDDILIYTAIDGWTGSKNLWCRVLAVTMEPSKGRAILAVTRTEKASLE